MAYLLATSLISGLALLLCGETKIDKLMGGNLFVFAFVWLISNLSAGLIAGAIFFTITLINGIIEKNKERDNNDE